MRHPIATLFACAVLALVTMAFGAEVVTEQQVIDLVERTAKDVAQDSAGTFARITRAEPPYNDKQHEEFYVFVYDTDVNLVAHPQHNLVGRNYRGKPDVKGTPFRDQIVEGALKNTTGWVEYFYQKPGASGIFKKKVYYRQVLGSDGKQYVVCSGMYAR